MSSQSETAVEKSEGLKDAPKQEQPPPIGAREVLRIGNFRLLWTGQIISDFGNSLTNLALLIIVNHLTNSTAALATMAIVLALPQITFGLIAGVYVDRLDRKRIMLASDFLRGFLVLGFILVASKENLWLLYVLAFLESSIGTFFTPARSALIPNIVPAPGLLAANSLAQTSSIIFGLLGTATAGLIIGSFDVYWPVFTIDALTFFISFAFISRLKVAAHQPASEKGSVAVIFRQLGAGLSLIFHNRVLLGVLVAAGITMLGLGAVNILIVPLIINDLRVPATWFGIVDFAQTAGMIISGLAMAVLASRFKTSRIVSIGLIIVGVLISTVFAINSIWQLLIILFVLGLAVSPVTASVSTLMQTSVSNEMLGRSGAALNTLVTSASLVSMAFAGVLGDSLGIRNVFVIAGAITVIAGIASAWVFRTAASQTAKSETDSTDLPAPEGGDSLADSVATGSQPVEVLSIVVSVQ